MSKLKDNHQLLERVIAKYFIFNQIGQKKELLSYKFILNNCSKKTVFNPSKALQVTSYLGVHIQVKIYSINWQSSKDSKPSLIFCDRNSASSYTFLKWYRLCCLISTTPTKKFATQALVQSIIYSRLWVTIVCKFSQKLSKN